MNNIELRRLVEYRQNSREYTMEVRTEDLAAVLDVLEAKIIGLEYDLRNAVESDIANRAELISRTGGYEHIINGLKTKVEELGARNSELVVSLHEAHFENVKLEAENVKLKKFRINWDKVKYKQRIEELEAKLKAADELADHCLVIIALPRQRFDKLERLYKAYRDAGKGGEE